MKAVIFAGGFGTRLSEETSAIPKPLVEIGSLPILLHIMQIYARHGVKDFVVLVGYKGHMIKEFFLNYLAHVQDLSIDLNRIAVTYMDGFAPRPDWRITIIDTGLETMTGGRLARVRELLANESYFALTYGDGVTDIDITELERFHLEHGKIATISAVRPPGRFGALELLGSKVTQFTEKPVGDGAYINGGFFIVNRSIFDYLTDDNCILEQGPLKQLAAEGELIAFVHNGFWQCMDTLRDKKYLDELCKEKKAPWINYDGAA